MNKQYYHYIIIYSLARQRKINKDFIEIFQHSLLVVLHTKVNKKNKEIAKVNKKITLLICLFSFICKGDNEI